MSMWQFSETQSRLCSCIAFLVSFAHRMMLSWFVSLVSCIHFARALSDPVAGTHAVVADLWERTKGQFIHCWNFHIQQNMPSHHFTSLKQTFHETTPSFCRASKLSSHCTVMNAESIVSVDYGLVSMSWNIALPQAFRMHRSLKFCFSVVSSLDFYGEKLGLERSSTDAQCTTTPLEATLHWC